jgi:predicted nucleotidyltransferase
VVTIKATMNQVYTLDEIAVKIKPIIEKYGIKKAAIFGSYARGDAIEKSDIDLLFDFTDDFGFGKYYKLENKIRAVLKKKVDILSFDYINEYMRDSILKEAIIF